MKGNGELFKAQNVSSRIPLRIQFQFILLESFTHKNVIFRSHVIKNLIQHLLIFVNESLSRLLLGLINKVDSFEDVVSNSVNHISLKSGNISLVLILNAMCINLPRTCLWTVTDISINIEWSSVMDFSSFKISLWRASTSVNTVCASSNSLLICWCEIIENVD